jgi:outer membrane protein OmpA-like peptidoglycan-associated protein
MIASKTKFIFLALIFALHLTAQQKAIVKNSDTVFCDCENARVVKIKNNYKIGPTIAPYGFGTQEISNPSKRNKFLFEKEHFSSWYKIIAESSGNLSFTVRPAEKKDDYDFILYKAENDSFCKYFHKYKDKPLRSNISRGDTAIAGTTGLVAGAKNNFEHEGKAPAWSKTIEIKKGETYYLVLDNVHENGKGHSIEFFIKTPVDFTGTVTDDKSAGIGAEVTVSDQSGKEVFKTESDKATGKYTIKTELTPGVPYFLNFVNDSSFVESKKMTVDSFVKVTPVVTKLPRLKRGEKAALKNINFYGNSEKYLPVSLPSIMALSKLMNRNKKLSIQLEGHVNGCSVGVKQGQQLSEDRAKSIYMYLIRNGVEPSRIKTIGYGCSKMLFKNPKNESENEANRRVEVNILDF